MQNGKPVILCIDDDADVLDSLKLVLEAHGFVVVLADSAEEGVRQYKQCQPDLIICDLMMEEIDAGTNFAKEMRVLGNQAPIFMYSSVGDTMNLSADYAEIGFAGVLQKPISPERLVNTIKAKLKKP